MGDLRQKLEMVAPRRESMRVNFSLMASLFRTRKFPIFLSTKLIFDFSVLIQEMPIIVIDGLIGGGKSTILKQLGKHFKIEQQRISDWTLLTDFYHDPKKFAFPLQKQIIKSYNDIALEHSNSTDIVLVESCALASLGSFGSMLLADGVLSELEMKELKEMVVPVIPSLYVWVETKVETSKRRIKKRGREGEEAITDEYLDRLKGEYMGFLEKNENLFPIMVVENDEDDAQREIAESILAKITLTQEICLVGNIGSGKTTLGKKMNWNFLEQILTPEISSILIEKYGEGEKTFQLQKAFIKMYKEQKEKRSSGINCWEDVLSVIPVFSKAALHNGEISKTDFDILSTLYGASLPPLEDFKLVIWLRPPIDILLHRIKERGRPGEEHIKREYLELLDSLMCTFLSKAKNVLVIDNSILDDIDVAKIIRKKINQVWFR